MRQKLASLDGLAQSGAKKSEFEKILDESEA